MTRYKLFLLTAALISLTGCRDEYIFDGTENGFAGEPSLSFRARIADSGAASQTRAMSQPSINVEPSEFPGYFYVEINAPTWHNPEDKDAPTQNKSKFGLYQVPKSGNGGMLDYVGTDEYPPNWFTIDDEHYFWSWTLPWLEVRGLEVPTWTPTVPDPVPDPEPPVVDPNGFNFQTRDGEEAGGEDDNNNGGDNGDNNGENEETGPVLSKQDAERLLNTSPIRVKLKDTFYDEFRYIPKTDTTEFDSTWNPGSWGNGYFFEQFIGAHPEEARNYRKNGRDVPLDFRHLMSKIAVRSLLFYRADGTTEEGYKANITFINMPTEFTFYPHPDHNGTPGADDQYMKKDGPPIVVTNQSSANPNGGITFGFTNPIDLLPDEHPDNKVQYRDKFYICPEIDFSKVSFMVEVSDSNRMKRGEYYGDFSSVAFDREDDIDYNKPTDANGDIIDDTTVLHAGEVMYFDLIVRESGGGGYTIYVRNWSTRPLQQAKRYPHPGIYVDGEAIEVLGTGTNWESKYASYGDGYWDNSEEPESPTTQNPGVVHVYNDIQLGNRYTFPVDKEYVINGMGHTMTFTPSNQEQKTITIGKMVDVYLEMNGSTIYIDPEGNICTFDPSSNRYVANGQKIDPTGEKSSFTIDITTGKVS